MEAVIEHLSHSLSLIIQPADQVSIEADRVELEVVDLVSAQIRGDAGWVYVSPAVAVHYI